MVNPAILFLTNSELGQASVCLAVAHEFLIRQNNVHIASFTPLSNAISTLNTRVSTLSPSPTRATFHPIRGLPMREAVSQKWSLDIFNIHEVGFRGALRAYKTVLGMSVPWDGPQYMEIYHSCVDIIKRTKPDIIVVDPLLGQAKDACRALGRTYIILSPNTFKEHVPQPWLANFWKYPQYIFLLSALSWLMLTVTGKTLFGISLPLAVETNHQECLPYCPPNSSLYVYPRT